MNEVEITVQAIVRPGQTISSREYKRRIGGKGANQAVAIARAGGQVNFYGAIGTDGKWLTNEMNEDGLNVGGIIVSNVNKLLLLIPLSRCSFSAGTYWSRFNSSS